MGDAAKKWAKYCRAQCRRHQERHPGKTLAEVSAQRDARACRNCGESIAGTAAFVRFCSAVCREWWHHHPGVDYSEWKSQKSCEVCGDPIIGRRPHARTCSQDCVIWRWNNPGKPRPKLQDRKCLHCGGAIAETRNRGAKYCSPECSGRGWHANDRRENPENLAKWRAKNEERIREYGARRRALEFDNPGYVAVSVKEWLTILRIYNWRCAYCLQLSERTLEREHVIPLTAGGRHAPGNLVPACRSCNSRKRDKLLSAWRLEMRKAGGDYEVAAFRRRPAKNGEAA